MFKRKRFVSIFMLCLLVFTILSPLACISSRAADYEYLTVTPYSALKDTFATQFKQFNTNLEKNILAYINSGTWDNSSTATNANQGEGFEAVGAFVRTCLEAYPPDVLAELKCAIAPSDGKGWKKAINKSYRNKFVEKITASSDKWKGTTKPPAKLAKKLGVSQVVLQKKIASMMWIQGLINGGPSASIDTIAKGLSVCGDIKISKWKQIRKLMNNGQENVAFVQAMQSGGYKAFFDYGKKARTYMGFTPTEKDIDTGGNIQLIDHKGKLLPHKDIYGHMDNFPSSFGDINYMDVAVPYATNIKQIGGFSASNRKVGSYWNIENDPAGGWQSGNTTHINKCVATQKQAATGDAKSAVGLHHASEVKQVKNLGGLNVFVDSYGACYALTAVQQFFSNHGANYSYVQGYGKLKKANEKKFKNTKSIDNNIGDANGTLIDIILTNGTVVHFIQFDENAVEHTNPNHSASDIEPGFPNPNQPYAKYYGHIASTSSGNCLEICVALSNGSTDIAKFKKAAGADKNPICYYRVYNANIGVPATYKTAPTKLGLITNVADCSTVGMTLTGGADEDSENPNGTDENGGNDNLPGQQKETDYVSTNYLNEIYVEMASLDDFSDTELYNLELWKNDVHSQDMQTYIIDSSRWIVLSLGIALIVWSILIYLAYWFDVVNNFVDIELLPLLTFKRLRRAHLEEDVNWHASKNNDGNKQRTIDHKRMLIVTLLGITLGILVITGQLFIWVANIMNWLMRFMGNLWDSVV